MTDGSTGSDRWHDLLCHTIGLTGQGSPFDGPPTRNHFAAEIDSPDDVTLSEMAGAGLVFKGGCRYGLRHYGATEAGIATARAVEAERRRAAGLRRWEVSYPFEDDDGRGARTETVYARSRGAARWAAVVDFLEAGGDKMWALNHIRVRALDRVERKRAAP